MSKRITLTDFEIEQIVNGLAALRDDKPAVSYEVVKVGQRFYDSLIKKLQKASSREGNPNAN